MSVKRYRLEWRGRNSDYTPCMAEVDEGAIIRIQAKEFVKASDYDALAQVNAELLEALKEVAAEARHPDYDWSVALLKTVHAAIAKATEVKP